MNIIFYTKRGCPWCDEAREFLNHKGLPYEEREVLANKAFFDELVEKSGQSKTPTFDVDGEIVSDSSAKEFEEYLNQKLK